MKASIILCFSLFCCLCTWSQCVVNEDITTQEQLDSLSGCTHIIGHVRIKGTNFFDNLDALQDVEIVEGNLDINVPGIADIDGFSKLKEVEILFLDGYSLKTISGFENLERASTVYCAGSRLTSIDGFNSLDSSSVIIRENGILESVSGFTSLEVAGTVEVMDNKKLPSIDAFQNLRICDQLNFLGLDSLKTIPQFDLLDSIYVLKIWATGLEKITGFNNLSFANVIGIRLNEQLTSIDGFHSSYEGAFLALYFNIQLDELNAFENSTFTPDARVLIESNFELGMCCALSHIPEANFETVSDNDLGCSSALEIYGECYDNYIEVCYFFDEDRDGIRDLSEDSLKVLESHVSSIPVPNVKVTIDENYERLYFAGQNCELINDSELFDFTTQNLQYNFSSGMPNALKADVGLSPRVIVEKSTISLFLSQRGRCSEKATFKAAVTNRGSVPYNGSISISIPSDFSNPIASAGAEQLSDTTYVWKIDELPPTLTECYELTALLPDEDFTGEIYCVEGFLSNQSSIEDSIDFCFPLRCAFDPNDKFGTPYRGGAENYTLFEERMAYTIRFENLGNDTAFDVRIEDPLAMELDTSSFRLIDASHRVTDYSIDENNLLNLWFDDIQLPSKEQDTIANKGYVHFTIETKEDLPEYTRLENTASIFFDSNAPVVTNTTLHTLVTTIPSTSTQELFTNVTIYPNPTEGLIRVEGISFDACELIDLSGRTTRLEVKSLSELDISEINGGVYFLRFFDKKQVVGQSKVVVLR